MAFHTENFKVRRASDNAVIDVTIRDFNDGEMITLDIHCGATTLRSTYAKTVIEARNAGHEYALSH